jgi:hypothetical protein
MAEDKREKAIRRPRVNANEVVFDSKTANSCASVWWQISFNSAVFVGESTSPASKLHSDQPVAKAAQLVISLSMKKT